ncbi:helix-turn-helix transcriptional regulator [Fictibacillus sp. 7GRE50]|uniref:winged helix-turn-helix transcriptional regulator n=1 Tax=unclassified Fictibacillus TaxID=2644029 RepID=UPI0018CCDD04|nr:MULTISPECIES: helix-turn-helix domain-containing protein [unclassified Fictibacillus]MBH0165018.1 helix-turn-helix transcriptional regulator [Fictibacillus sp. 7GRE50]MBH0172385.1 helix-turn-helix transcriptional regulator [Fictibacillus sp. 23RED33]
MSEEGYKRKEDCPLTFALTLIGSKWRLPIIWALWKNKRIRYNELKRQVDGITNMVLSQSLKEMEKQGLIVRTQFMEIPPRVEYSLTEAGEALIPSLKSLAEWGKEMQIKVKAHV